MSVFDDIFSEVAQKNRSSSGATPKTGNPDVFTDLFAEVSNPKKYKEEQAKKAQKKVEPTPPTPAAPAAPVFAQTKSSQLFGGEPLTAGSASSTTGVPTQRMTDASQKVEKKALDVIEAVRNLKTSDNAGARIVGNTAEWAARTVKNMDAAMIANSQAKTFGEKARTLLDFGIAALDIDTPVFDVGPAVAGASAEARVQSSPLLGAIIPKGKTGQAVEFAGKKLTELLGVTISAAANKLVSTAANATGTELSPEWETTLNNAAAVAIPYVGIKVGAISANVAHARKTLKTAIEADMVAPAADTLGINLANKLNEKKLADAYKAALTKAAEEGGPMMQAKMDVIDASYRVLSDYQAMGPVRFQAKWNETHRAQQAIADEIVTKAEAVRETSDTMDRASFVNTVLRDDTLRGAKKKLDRIESEPDLRLAFESEMVDMNAELDPKLQKRADTQGFGYSRIDNAFADTPATFDMVDGKPVISLNEPVIRAQVARMMDGQVLIVGEGVNRRVFRRAEGDSFESLKTRYEKQLLEHEMAHLKTVRPEDMAEWRAASVAGDSARANKIRLDLEKRANDYMFEKGSELSEEARNAVEGAAYVREARQDYRATLAEQRFADRKTEAEYQTYKKARKDGSLTTDSAKGTGKVSDFEQRFQVEERAKRALDNAKARLEEQSKGVQASEAKLIRAELDRASKLDRETPSVSIRETRTVTETPEPAIDRNALREPGIFEAENRSKLEAAVQTKNNAEKLKDDYASRLVDVDTEIREQGGRSQAPTALLVERADLIRGIKAFGELVDTLPARVPTPEVKIVKRNITTAEQRLFKERIANRIKNQVAQEKFDARVKKVRDSFADKAAVRQQIVDFMRENKVPMDIRGKFVARLKNAGTPEQAASVMRDIAARWDKRKRQAIIQKTRDFLESAQPKRNASGVLMGDMTPEVQAKLQEIYRYSQMDSGQLGIEMVKVLDDYTKTVENSSNTTLPEGIAERLDLMEMGRLDSKSIRQLQNNLAAIEDLRKTGKTERARMIERKQRGIRLLAEDAVKTVSGSTNSPVAIQSSANKSFLASGLYGTNAASTPLVSLVDRLGTRASRLAGDLASVISKAQTSYNQGGESFAKRAHEIYGSEADYIKAQRRLNKPVKGPVMESARLNADGQRVKVNMTMTPYHAMEVYLFDRDPDARVRLRHERGNGYTQEMVDYAESLLTEQDKAIAELVVKVYAEEHAPVAKRVGEDTGVFLPKRERYSGKLSTEGDVDKADAFVVNMLQDHFSRLSTRPEFTKGRGDVVRPLRFSENPVFDLMAYMRKARYYVNVSPYAQKLDGLMMNKDFADAVATRWGKSTLATLRFANDAVKRGAETPWQLHDMARLGNRIANNYAGAVLQTPKVATGQFASIFGFRASVADSPTKGRFKVGVAKTLENLPLMYEYAPSLKARFELVPEEQIRRVATDRNLFTRATDKLADVLRIPLETADKITTLTGASGIWETKVAEYLAAGKDLETARRLAGRFIDTTIMKTQSTRSFFGKSQIEMSNDLFKAMAALQNQPNKIARANVEAVRKFREGKMTVRQLADFLVWNAVIQPAAYASIRAATGATIVGATDLITKPTQDEKNEREEKNAPLRKDVAFSLLEQNTGFLVLGGILKTAVARISGKNFEYRPALLSSVIDETMEMLDEIGAGDYNEAAVLSLRTTLRTLGIGFFSPMLDYWVDMMAAANNADRAEERKRDRKLNPAKYKTKK